MLSQENQMIIDELVDEAKRPASLRPYVGHVRVPTKTFLSTIEELREIRKALEWTCDLERECHAPDSRGWGEHWFRFVK
jgi:hypothetical protein